MSMIFPGMDPYLESPAIFPGIHHRLTVYMADQMNPLLQPRYVTSIGDRVYVEGPTERAIIPDVWLRRADFDGGCGAVAVAETDEPVLVLEPELEIHEPYIEILDRESGMSVVTILELVSPKNKYTGPGRAAYVAKQQEIRQSQTHLVEIDLLRYGPHVLAVSEASVRGRFAYDYLVSVNRAAGFRERFEVYPRTIRQRLPLVRIPLAGNDPDIRLDLRAALELAYTAGSYADRIDYSAPCPPPLQREDRPWAEALIAGA